MAAKGSLDALADAMEKAAASAVDSVADDLLDFAVKERSSGPYSLEELRKMGHPYAARHAVPLLPPEIINEQSGVFQSSWVKEAQGDQASVFNTDPKGEMWLEPGTSKMVPRPVWDGVFDVEERLAEAIDRFMS